MTKRCLGWMCNWRDHCALHLLPEQPTIQSWFQPSLDKVAERCEFYVAAETPHGA